MAETRGRATSAAAPALAFGHHDIAAAFEVSDDRARRRRRLGMVVPIAFFSAAGLMLFDVIPQVPGFGGLGMVLILFAQRLLQWQRDDLMRELKTRGAPPRLVAATKAFFGEPAVRRPANLEHYLAALALRGVDQSLLGPALQAALQPWERPEDQPDEPPGPQPDEQP